jgi:membrane associated rhomboid family serine protease
MSLIVGFLYGSLIWGVLPSQPGVSWQAHFFGFVGGAVAAQLLGRRKKMREF